MKYVMPAIIALLLSCQAASASEASLKEIEIQPQGEATWKEKPNTEPVLQEKGKPADVEETAETTPSESEETTLDISEEKTNREKIAEMRNKIYSFFDGLFSDKAETSNEEKEEVVAKE